MALNYSTIEELDLGKGFDQRSAENLIQPGFSEDLLNIETVMTRLKKRVGYQGYSGHVPVRVTGYFQSGNEITFTLDNAIDLISVETTPLIAYGRSEVGSGTFGSSSSSEYYSGFTTSFRKTLDTADTPVVLDSSDHGTTSNLLFVGVAESTSLSSTNSNYLLTDGVSIEQSTADVTITYDNDTGSNISSFVYYSNKTVVAGTTFAASYTSGTGAHAEPISAATHGLTNAQILVELYEDTGTDYLKVIPDSVEIATNGDVTINTTQDVATDYVAILSAVPIANIVSKSILNTGALAPGDTQDLLITGNNSPFIFAGCYLEPTVGGTLESVLPDSIEYDEASDTHTITITNNSGSPKNIEIYYEYGFLLSNTLTVTSTTSGTVSDSNPELTLYGLCHADIYGANKSGRDGWVTLIDHYRRSAEQRTVVGLNGNLFRTLTDFESPLVHPEVYPFLRGRLDSDQSIGPAFNSPDRTRGTYQVTGANSGLVEVDAATWISSSTVEYKLLTPGRSKTGTPIGLDYDLLTVSGMGNSKLNGEFEITGIDETDPDFLLIEVTNSSISDGDYDEVDAGGRAGVFTDQLELVLTSTFEAGDVLLSDQFGAGSDLEVLDNDGSFVRFKNNFDRIEAAGGLRVVGKRTSSTIPLRDEAGLATVEDLVVGDTLSYAPIDRLLRIISIDPTGKTITVDEELEWQDALNNSTGIEVPRRWIPIESPISNTTRVKYFSNSSLFLKSTAVNDTLFVTNGEDSTLKFDGSTNYRAGLPRWEPGLFLKVDEGASGLIDVGNSKAAVTAVATNVFTVAAGDETLFKVGSVIRHDNDQADYEVTDTKEGEVFVKALDGSSGISGAASGNITNTVLFKYYFRLNAVDANSNIIISAMAQSEDMRARLGPNAAVVLKMLNFPNFDEYDYENLEVEIYRSTANTEDFFKIVTLPLIDSEAYLTFVDTLSDDTIAFSSNQDVGVNLAGGELGRTWSDPLLAKYVTSANNSLVLANVKSLPELSLVISSVSNEVSNSDLIGQTFQIDRDDILIGSSTDIENTVKYTFVDLASATSGQTLTVAGTTGTITGSPGFTAGDWVYIQDETLEASGWWQASEAATIEMPGVTASALPIKYSTIGADVPVPLGLDLNQDQVNANNTSTFARINAARRLGMAINASMTNNTVADFKPWIRANAGNDFGAGQVVLRQPSTEVTVPAFTSPSSISGWKLFVDGNQAAASTSYSFGALSFRSRLLVSYPNFPELFDAPTDPDPGFSDSVIDVNSADGQEITGVIPFFGDSAFGAAQKSGILLVFKTNSIYLVDISQKEAYRLGIGGSPNPVQKLETEGLGCTVPASIAVTNSGVMFANTTGIYRINRQFLFEYIGSKAERQWRNRVDLDNLEIATGHHFNTGQQYKLSVPIGPGSTENSEVLVYDHSDEVEGIGGWTRFDNHPATGWANLDSDAFFGSTDGRVFSIRRTGSDSDYRDDRAAISFEATLRALDFGTSATRKSLAAVISHFRVLKQSNNTKLYLAADLSTNFELTTGFDINSNEDTLNNLSDASNLKVATIRHSMDKRKSVYIQAKYTNDGIDEPLELAGVGFRVAPLTQRGTTEAADT